MGWSPEINPWSKPLDGRTNAALEKEASAYTGLSQQKMIRDFSEKACPSFDAKTEYAGL